MGDTDLDRATCDLRDPNVWRAWAASVRGPAAVAIAMSGVHYVSEDDVLLFVFPHSAKSVIDQGGGEDLVDQIRLFYDSKRNAWLSSIHDFEQVPVPPRHVLMPRIILELGAPSAYTH